MDTTEPLNSAARNQLDEQDYESNDQQYVDVPRNNVEAYESDQPQDEKNDEDRPQH
jgi:hypothetical protein